MRMVAIKKPAARGATMMLAESANCISPLTRPNWLLGTSSEGTAMYAGR